MLPLRTAFQPCPEEIIIRIEVLFEIESQHARRRAHRIRVGGCIREFRSQYLDRLGTTLLSKEKMNIFPQQLTAPIHPSSWTNLGRWSFSNRQRQPFLQCFFFLFRLVAAAIILS